MRTTRRAVATLCALLGAQSTMVAQSAPKVTMAVVGGRIIDGYGGPVLENGVILIAGDKIVSVGRVGELAVPTGATVIDANGHTVMPGLIDMHVHLHILGHGDYKRWDDLYGTKDATVVMPIAARQLLMAGVTTARDLGARLDDILSVKKRIASGEIPGPRLFVTGPFIQHAAYERYEEAFRWGVNGADDARKKVTTLLDAGVDMIKLIDQDQMTEAEVQAVVETTHKRGKMVVAHAHRMDEIRVGLKYNVDDFEHTGLGTAPGYPEDVLQGLRQRNSGLYWTPTISPLYTMYFSGSIFPERIDDPAWHEFMPEEMWKEIRTSLEHIPQLPYYALFPSRITLISDNGSPRTRMMSAKRPGASTPKFSSPRRNLAGHSVALWIVSMGDTPSSTHFTISRHVASLWNMLGMPASVPISMRTPVWRSWANFVGSSGMRDGNSA